MMASSRIKRSDIQLKLKELRIKYDETLKLVEKLEKGLKEQNRVKSEYEGAIISLSEILTGKKAN